MSISISLADDSSLTWNMYYTIPTEFSSPSCGGKCLNSKFGLYLSEPCISMIIGGFPFGLSLLVNPGIIMLDSPDPEFPFY